MIVRQEQIDEAWRQVEARQRAASKPNATIEDELQLQCARNWLLTLQNRALHGFIRGHMRRIKQMGTIIAEEPAPKPTRPRDRAELAFSKLRKLGS